MNFRKIHRPAPVQPPRFSSTPRGTIRLASHGVSSGGSRLVIFWLSFEVAERIGLVERRETVSLLTDPSGEVMRVAIKSDPDGDFRASRRSNAYSVHTDALTARALLGPDGWLHDIVPADQLEFSPGMVAFPLPVRIIDRRGS